MSSPPDPVTATPRCTVAAPPIVSPPDPTIDTPRIGAVRKWMCLRVGTVLSA
jgi:hypothetical protein